MTTPNKGYATPATGSEVDNWGNVLNEDVSEIIDRNLGGITTRALTNVNISLTTEESQNLILRLTGVLTGNVVVTTECIGMFFVENATTGSFTVTVRNNLISTSTTAPQGGRVVVISTATNGCRISGTSDFPSGTRMPFNQTTVPTGWTKESSSTYDDAAIRLTTGTVSTGGSLGFSDTFDSRMIALANLPNHSVGVSINDPQHRHTLPRAGSTLTNISPGGSLQVASTANEETSFASTGITASGTFGNTQRGGAQTAMNFNVKYVEFTVGTKN